MNRSKSGLFLMELIIAIAFFSFASAICVQLFSVAHNLRQRSFNIQMAVGNAQSAAEVFKTTGGDAYYMTSLLESDYIGGQFITHYCDEWLPAEADNARYTMTVNIDRTIVPSRALIIITDDFNNTELYNLEVRRYLGGR